MSEKFKLWSQTNQEAKSQLNPNLGMREWAQLSYEERECMWCYLKDFFYHDVFVLEITIYKLNELHKVKSLGKHYLEIRNYEAAKKDFYNIFLSDDHSAVIELLSIYSFALIAQHTCNDKTNYEQFDKFKYIINEIFEQFGINVVLTRNQFVSRQDLKIIEEIYQPVLNFLSDKRWKEVNRELKDAFEDYQKKDAKGYSGCITQSVSAIQAFLQILIYGKIGKGKIKELIFEGQKKKLIPADYFSTKIFKDIESIVMVERQNTGDPHPKKDYANEKSARLILNLTMIFLQHCIQK